ncbi:MAG: SDR family oxidoreductase [Bacteroidetes bacterium]|nr:SDR family oxidoreductase [Bacteroidota bacterium]
MTVKTMLVVGGSGGIGSALIARLQTRGVQCIDWSRTVGVHKEGVLQIQTDITADTALPEICGPLHGLVYCPGSINLKPFHRISMTEFRQEMEINFMGAVRCLQHVLPNLKEGKGSVVLFSTVAVQTGMPFHSSIAAAKGAVEGLVHSLAAELAPHIRINGIAPSLTHTPLAEKLLSTPEKQEAAAQRHPLKRTGTPDDIAAMADFLLSEDASWISGRIFAVDGGMGNLKI